MVGEQEKINHWIREQQNRLTEFTKEYIAILNNYRSVRKKKLDKTIVKSILKRYNLLWSSPAPSRMEELKFKNFSQDFPHEVILKIARRPIFKRLIFIRQLGTTFISMDLNATHTRLAHSLGTAAFAESFLKFIDKNYGLKESEKMAVRLYAFIHDTFHGPFGHSLELMSDIFNREGKTGWKIDKFFLFKYLQSDHHPLVKELRRCLEEYLNGEEVEEVFRLLRKFVNKDISQTEELGEKYFLLQIVDSLIDSDRLDYILRDTYHLDFDVKLEVQRIYEMLSRVKILPIEIEINSEKNKKEKKRIKIKSLAFSKKDKNLIESVILSIRRRLYEEIYHNPQKIAIDQMIAHSVYYLLREIDENLVKRNERNEDIDEIIEELHQLTDEGLMNFIFEIGKPLYSVELLRDVLHGNFYVPLEIIKISFTEKELEEMNEKIKEFNERYKEMIEERKKRLQKLGMYPIGRKCIPLEDMVKFALDITKDWDDKHLIVLFEIILCSAFHEKCLMEEKIWKYLIEKKEFEKIFREYISQKMGYIYEETIEQLYEELKKYPHIFISIPPFIPRSWEKWAIYTQELSEDILVYYDENGNPIKEQPDVPLRKSLGPTQMFLCVPHPFEKKGEDLIKEAFEKIIIKEKEWIRFIEK